MSFNIEKIISESRNEREKIARDLNDAFEDRKRKSPKFPLGRLILESKVDFNKNISNEVIFEDGDKKIKYVGHVKGLRFYDSGSLAGSAYLNKYKFAENFLGRKKWKKEWSLAFRDSYHNTTFVNYVAEIQDEYRTGLKAKASLDEGIHLSEDLLQAIFEPIDEKLVEQYNKFNK